MSSTDETVFIVDDDPSVMKGLARLIRSAGWTVEAYASGHELLSRLPFAGRGCVILDLTMPVMSGTELCNQMAELGAALPVIFLTGAEDPVLLEKAAGSRGTNFVGFLTKPVDAKVLLDAIRTALDRAAPKPEQD
jgi:FixJ family two-component response regulator